VGVLPTLLPDLALTDARPGGPTCGIAEKVLSNRPGELAAKAAHSNASGPKTCCAGKTTNVFTGRFSRCDLLTGGGTSPGTSQHYLFEPHIHLSKISVPIRSESSAERGGGLCITTETAFEFGQGLVFCRRFASARRCGVPVGGSGIVAPGLFRSSRVNRIFGLRRLAL
jgi:hypothetical protein